MMRRLALVAVALLCGCGSVPTAGPQAAAPGLALGEQRYVIDQLAPSPDDGSGVHLEYAVIRVTTGASQHTVHTASFVLLDATGRRYAAVHPAVYVPIDGLDGLIVAPGHTGAGVVAFPPPAAPPREILVTDGSLSGALDAP